MTRNFSVGGLCLVLQERHEPGAVLKLAFRLGTKDNVVAVMGRVQWVEEIAGGSGISYDTGIAFLASPETLLAQDAKPGLQSAVNAPDRLRS